jgi:hypothetical protein
MTEEKAPTINEIKIGNKSKPKDVITQCEKLLKDEKIKDIHLSAVSNSIGELVIVVEILKSMYPKLHQQNKFTTITPRFSDKSKENESKSPKLLFPRLEIILSSKEEEKAESSQVAITEEERKILIETLDTRKTAFKKVRRFRRPFRNNRRWGGYNGNRGRQRYAYSARKSGFNRRRPVYNYRRPFGKLPDGNKNNFRKFNATWKNNGNKKVSPKN